MEAAFQLLSSAARFNKGKKKRTVPQQVRDSDEVDLDLNLSSDDPTEEKSRDRTGKRDSSTEKLELIRKEEIAAFRNAMNIKIANKHDPDLPDPLSSFADISSPSWWASKESSTFETMQRVLLRNIEAGRWKEPTPIQMQAIPSLLEKRDIIACATTGSGKTGAFSIPSLILVSAPSSVFYNAMASKSDKEGRKGEIRALLLAPSLELAAQIHREVQRLGTGKPGGLTSQLLSKANAAQVIAGEVGGKNGLDILVATPLRLVDSIEKGLRLNTVRIVVLDEADRLLDATDGKGQGSTSGSGQTRSFLAQMDSILSEVPTSAVRALFSATITTHVRSLSEAILRNPIDVTIASTGSGGANKDIEQSLTFCGLERGKLLAIRQMHAKGELLPPAIIFVESQDRAQALFGELLYDGMRVDVIHAGRSKSARENAVAKFRKGDTWLLICTDLVARGVDFRAVKMVINYDLPSSGISYIHRIGRCGRAGRKGKAITFFTEADFQNLRTIANVMQQSGCDVQDWMLGLSKNTRKEHHVRSRRTIDTTPSFDRRKKRRRSNQTGSN